MAEFDPAAELLYDPLFETPPDTVIRDKPGRGFWGKAVVRKTAFVLVLTLFVGVTIALSVNSLTKARFHYEETDGGWRLVEFNAAKTDAVLMADAVYDEDDVLQEGKTLTSIRTFAVCGNEYTSFIFVGKDVKELPNTAFYSCKSLLAVLVDPRNPYYADDGGVLYRLEDGAPAELLLYPACNDLYRAMLTLGEARPGTKAEAETFAERAKALDARGDEEAAEGEGSWWEAQEKHYPDPGFYALSPEESAAMLSALTYDILPGVTVIGEMAFAECKTLYGVNIPEGVTDVATMAFFKCPNLRAFDLPDSLRTIGSDGFSYCAKVTDIFIPAGVTSVGHHAFWGCDGADEIRMACAEADAPLTGQDWLPKKRKLFLHDVPVVYDQQRRAEG